MRLLLSLIFLSTAASASERCVCRLSLGERLLWRWESLGTRDPAGTALEFIAKSKNQAICITPDPARFAHYQAKSIALWAKSESIRLRRWYSVFLEKGGIRHLERLMEVSTLPIQMVVMGKVAPHEVEGALTQLEMIHSGMIYDAVGKILVNEVRNPSLHGFLDRFPHVSEQLGKDYPGLLRMVTRAREHAAHDEDG